MMKLRKITTLELETDRPFNFRFTIWKPSHFTSSLEIFDEKRNSCYRTMLLGKRLLGLRFTELDSVGIKAEVYSNSSLNKAEEEDLTRRLRGSYGLDEDLNDFYKIAKKDRLLRPTLRAMKGMRNSCFHTLFEILTISLVLQNTNVKRSQNMLRALLENYGKKVEFERKQMYVFFPPERIEEISEEELREKCRLGYRARYLKTIADAFLDLNIESKIRTLNYEEAKEELKKIKGIGEYSASIALVEYLRFPQFMTLDLWSKKIFSKLFFGHERADYDRIQKEALKRWNGYKGLGALYIMENLYYKGKVDSRGNVK